MSTTIAAHNARLQAAGLPTLETLERRILAVFDRATVSDVESGSTWYDDAQALARQWSLETEHDLEHCAAVLSHLSPRTTWTRNVMGAADLLRFGTKANGIIGANFDRAAASLDADDVESTFGGPKTRRFFRNIIGDSEAVTVDVWALRVAGLDDSTIGRVGVYDAIEAAYQRAARKRGVAPTTMQATTWIVARNGRAS
jgi:hypothetical protein